MLNKNEIKKLEESIRQNGVYEVIKTALDIGEKHVIKYESNQDATIHTDVKLLRECVDKMRSSHFLRVLKEG